MSALLFLSCMLLSGCGDSDHAEAHEIDQCHASEQCVAETLAELNCPFDAYSAAILMPVEVIPSPPDLPVTPPSPLPGPRPVPESPSPETPVDPGEPNQPADDDDMDDYVVSSEWLYGKVIYFCLSKDRYHGRM